MSSRLRTVCKLHNLYVNNALLFNIYCLSMILCLYKDSLCLMLRWVYSIFGGSQYTVMYNRKQVYKWVAWKAHVNSELWFFFLKSTDWQTNYVFSCRILICFTRFLKINFFFSDDIRCYCNLAKCVATGYMCRTARTQSGGCFSEVHNSNDKSVARHGCMELLQDEWV